MSFEKALRIFRKKVENAGVKDDLRKKEFYEKPNQKRRRKANEQKRRNQRARAKEIDMWNNYRSKFGRKAKQNFLSIFPTLKYFYMSFAYSYPPLNIPKKNNICFIGKSVV